MLVIFIGIETMVLILQKIDLENVGILEKMCEKRDIRKKCFSLQKVRTIFIPVHLIKRIHDAREWIETMCI